MLRVGFSWGGAYSYRLRFVNCVNCAVTAPAEPFNVEGAVVIGVVALDLRSPICRCWRLDSAPFAGRGANETTVGERIPDGAVGCFALRVGGVVLAALVLLCGAMSTIVAAHRGSVLLAASLTTATLGDLRVFAGLAGRPPAVLDAPLDVELAKRLGLPARSARLHGLNLPFLLEQTSRNRLLNGSIRVGVPLACKHHRLRAGMSAHR